MCCDRGASLCGHRPAQDWQEDGLPAPCLPHPAGKQYWQVGDRCDGSLLTLDVQTSHRVLRTENTDKRPKPHVGLTGLPTQTWRTGQKSCPGPPAERDCWQGCNMWAGPEPNHSSKEHYFTPQGLQSLSNILNMIDFGSSHI